MRTSALLRLAALTGLSILAACSGPLPPAGPLPPGQAAVLLSHGYAFQDGPARKAPPPAPPLSLTASDGTGLRLVELEARAIVEDPLAFTELHLTFDNPEDRGLEGTFAITLPEGAALSRFAMKIDDAWQEGEVLEKKAAREAYEDFLHRKQDPALLEQAAGNQFSARVFPIPPRGRKELIVAYSQELRGGRSWSLPLKGLPELGRLEVWATLAGEGKPAARLSRTNVKPEADFELDPRMTPPSAGLRSGSLVVARVRPVPDAAPDPLGPTLVLVDTSGSRALGFDEEVRVVDALVRRIAASAGPATEVVVGAFDQTAEAIFEGRAGDWGEADAARLRARQAFGASDLGRALGWAEGRAAARGLGRVVLVGDGVPTAGETAPAALGARAARLGAAGVKRLDVIAVGGIREDVVLKKVATAGLARDGIVIEATAGTEAIARRLALATRSGIAVAVEGARWSWPRQLDGVQPGDEALIYAEVPEGQPVTVRVGDGPARTLALPEVARPLLARSHAKAKIDSLLAQVGREPDPALVRQVIELSTQHRVLSPYTSLLVLETDLDYRRFSLDRKALADILAVDGGKLAVVTRRPPGGAPGAAPPAPDTRQARRADAPVTGAPPVRRPSVPSAPAPDPAPAAAPAATAAAAQPFAPEPLAARGNMWGSELQESYGAGGLGLSGVATGGGGRGEGIGLGRVGTVGHGAGSGSGQGFGSGHGRLGSSHRTQPPQVRMGATQVSGRLPSEVIQRIVRQNFGRVRRCYENGLRTSPSLQGRVAVRFVIGPDGAVRSSQDAGSDLPDATTVACVVRAMYDLTFPQPEGGIITVTYPFMFSPGDGSTSSSPPPSERQVTMPPADLSPPPSPAEPPQKRRTEPYSGRFKSVMDTIDAGGAKAAVEDAYAWHRDAPGDVMALVALGEALEAAREPATAARVYGSLVDLFPARADLRRFAGGRLERIGGAALDAAADTFAKAEEQRPDHPESHRLVAFAKLRQGDHAGAFAAAVRGIEQRYPSGRFQGVGQILREDLGLVAAAWIKAEPARQEEILGKLRGAGGQVEDGPSLRFVLSWETDANDVDFHIEDAQGGHAFFRDPTLPSGGRLYADVTTGYGPECFTIRLPKEERSAFYKLSAHYYSRGPMGYGMGKLEIIDHDGKGGLTFEERPYVVMVDQAFVDLGTVNRK